MAISSPEMMLVPVFVSPTHQATNACQCHTEVDVAEAATANLSADAVFIADAEILDGVSLGW
jgi:hypothetical protein